MRTGRPRTGRTGFHFVVAVTANMKTLIDERAGTLGLSRNSYVRMLILQDLARKPAEPFMIYPNRKNNDE